MGFSVVIFSVFAHCIQGLNTTGTLVSICQNDKFSFSFLKNTYLGLAQAITSTAATLGFWYIQKHFKFSTKTMASKLFERILFPKSLRLPPVAVCRHKCSDHHDSALGNDRDLDAEVRVGLSLSSTISFAK